MFFLFENILRASQAVISNSQAQREIKVKLKVMLNPYPQIKLGCNLTSTNKVYGEESVKLSSRPSQVKTRYTIGHRQLKDTGEIVRSPTTTDMKRKKRTFNSERPKGFGYSWIGCLPYFPQNFYENAILSNCKLSDLIDSGKHLSEYLSF